MSGMQIYGLWALIFLLSFPFEYIITLFSQILVPECLVSRVGRHACRIAIISATMALACLNLPLPAYYILLYGILWTTFLRLPGDGSCYRFVINQSMLFYTTLHLLVLGLLAVFSGTGIHSILNRQDTRLISLLVTLIIFYMLALFLSTPDIKEKIQKIPQCADEFTLYIRYSNFALVSILFDSLSALFRLPYPLMVLFLLGSSLLILLQTLLFFSHVCSIAQNAYLEEEHMYYLLERRHQLEREELLRHEIHVDALTGAYSRRYIEDNLQALLDGGGAFAFVYIDLDGLKTVNDTLGHTAGDQHLKQFVRMLSKYLRKNDILARVGGDEFYLILPDCSMATAHERMLFIQHQLSMEPGTINECPVSFSFGVSESKPGLTMSALIEAADQSMYVNKHSRRQL